MSINHLKIQNGLRLVPVTADPVDGQDGDLIYRSDLNVFRKYENGAWSDMSSAASDVFSDSLFRVQDNSDATKQIALEASAIATGTTRTISMPDTNVDLGDIAVAISDAGAAQADATQALTDAADAQADATQALSDAADAQADATQALTDASTAQAAADAAQDDVDDLISLSGVPANSEDLGTFTGSTISNNTTIKNALQELETALEGIPDPISYQGTYNATTNTPTLSNSDTGVSGYLYQVTVAGTQDFGAGPISFEIGDKVVNNGSIYEKWDMTDSVSSVNGQAGAVQIDAVDVPYDNTTSGLTATDVQAAIDELAASPAGANTALSNLTTTSINQNLLPDANDTRDIGSPSLMWDHVHAGAIGLSDTTTRVDIQPDQVSVFNNSDVLILETTSDGLLQRGTISKRATNSTGAASGRTRESYYAALTLANSVASFTTITSSGGSEQIQNFGSSALYAGIRLEYVVTEFTTGLKRIGTILAVYDGTNTAFSDAFSETGTIGTGLEFQVIESGGYYLIQFKNTGATGCRFSCEYKVYRE